MFKDLFSILLVLAIVVVPPIYSDEPMDYGTTSSFNLVFAGDNNNCECEECEVCEECDECPEPCGDPCPDVKCPNPCNDPCGDVTCPNPCGDQCPDVTCPDIPDCNCADVTCPSIPDCVCETAMSPGQYRGLWSAYSTFTGTILVGGINAEVRDGIKGFQCVYVLNPVVGDGLICSNINMKLIE